MRTKRISDFLTGSLLPVLVWGGLYLLFYSTNNSCDGLSYAADIRDGVDLFYPHHLLYNALGYVSARLFAVSRTLSLLCVINALAGALCLFIVRKILRKALPEKNLAACLWLLGACWGLMRFATEAETYILPLVFSLLGSLAWVRRKNPFWVSLWAAAACLFHQIHFFWWLGLGIGMTVSAHKKGMGSGKTAWFYLLGALLVPIVYLVVWLTVPNEASNYFLYVFHDYFYVDSVGFSFKHALLLTPVNFVRTFFQAHGYIPALLARYPLLAAGPLVALVCFVILGVRMMKRSATRIGVDSFPSMEAHMLPQGFAFTHLLIALLQLFFAFLSNGYPRFSRRLSAHGVALAALGIGAWNVCLGLIPYHVLEIQTFPAIERHMAENPTSTYVIGDYAIIYNRLRYYHPALCDNLKKDWPNCKKVGQNLYNRLFLFLL